MDNRKHDSEYNSDDEEKAVHLLGQDEGPVVVQIHPLALLSVLNLR